MRAVTIVNIDKERHSVARDLRWRRVPRLAGLGGTMDFEIPEDILNEWREIGNKGVKLEMKFD